MRRLLFAASLSAMATSCEAQQSVWESSFCTDEEGLSYELYEQIRVRMSLTELQQL